MRLFWLWCLLVVAIVWQTQESKGLTINIKLKEGFVLKISLKQKNGNETAETTNIDLPYTDQEQWKKLRIFYSGSTAEENIDNTTALFDRIIVVNAFARSGQVNDNDFLYQGDMLMNLDRFGSFGGTRQKRAIITFEYFRWDVERGIPYKLHRSLNDASRRVILSAMREWEQSLPCLKWRVKTDSDTDFVHFFKGDGCYSKIGRAGGEQTLSIGRGCEVHGIALHEMGHTIGMFHEQSRPDRDNYVKIIRENILEGFDTQFEKFGNDVINSYDIDYDYSSIMHYSATAFAKERGLVTIEPRPKRDVKFGQRDHLSKSDILQARAMYGCNEMEFVATPLPTAETQTTQASISSTQARTTTQSLITTEAPTTTETPTTIQIRTTTKELTKTQEPTTIQAPTTTQTPTTTQASTTTQAPTATQPPTTSHISSTTQIPITTQAHTKTQTPTTTQTATSTQTFATTKVPITTRARKGVIFTSEPTTTQVTTKKPKECVDLLSVCYKWIRKGFCSPISENYCFMKYFCRRTCEIWRNSELSRGASCVDLLPECESRAIRGHCSDRDKQEYMKNMCCESCVPYNCFDESRYCAIWERTRACFTYPFVQKNCKKSCDLCDFY